MRRYVDPEEALAAPFYALAGLLVLAPVVDFVVSTPPPSVGNIQWRLAVMGSLSSALLTPVLGVAIAMAVAAIREHVVFQRVLSILSLVTACAFVLVLAAFSLDALQLKGAVAKPLQHQFRVETFKAVFKYVTATIILAFLGIRGFAISSWRVPRSSTAGRIPLVSK